MVTVQVYWSSSGKPAGNQRVMLSFDGMRGVTSSQITNSEGRAHFDYNPGSGKVIVNGETKTQGQLSGNVIVYI